MDGFFAIRSNTFFYDSFESNVTCRDNYCSTQGKRGVSKGGGKHTGQSGVKWGVRMEHTGHD